MPLFYIDTKQALKEGLCDFYDECYLCYPISFPVKNKMIWFCLIFIINVCEADIHMKKQQKKFEED